MKITFVSPPPNLSGGNRVIAIYADMLTARGHEVTVVAPRLRAPTYRQRARALLQGRWLRTPSGESHFDGMQARLSLTERRGPVQDEDVPDADVVIATWWETAFAVASLAPSKGRKFYFVQHHEVHSHIPRHLSAGSYYLPLKKIVVSGWLRDIMAREYGDDTAALVPNSVDTDLFFSHERKRQPVPTVGLMYSSTYFKGVDVAFSAIELLRKRVPGVKVVAFGAHPPVPSLPLPPHTEYFVRPAQRDLRHIYRMCDVFLAASRSEGFGLPILEAMACGCPVVATRTGCAGDIIIEGENGHVTAVDDDHALAAGLQRVLELPDDAWRRVSAAAIRTATSYSWEDAADRFEAALNAG